MIRNTNQKYINAEEVRKAIRLLIPEGQVFEIRIIDGGSKVLSGYFKDAETMLQAVNNEYLEGANVYITLQRVKSDCMARRQSQKLMKGQKSTQNNDIAAYQWLFVDIDPERTSDTSSNEEELQRAFEIAKGVYQYMKDLGFHDPIKAISGNGAHLLYRIELQNTDKNCELVGRCLESLSVLFSNDLCKIDTVNANPARICKLYGTLAQKGTSTEDRPHRMSRIVQAPDRIEVNSVKLLQRLADQIPKSKAPARKNVSSDFDIESWMHKHGLQYKAKDFRGGTMFILEECPFDHSHKAPDAKIFKMNDGTIGFKCWHNSCSGKSWKDVRKLFEPDAYIRGGTRVQKLIQNTETEIKDTELQHPRFEDIRTRRGLLSTIKRIDPINRPEYCECSDKANGLLFANVFKNACRYNVTANQWYVFNGRAWQKDEGGKVVENYAKELTTALRKYAAAIGDKDYLIAVAKLDGSRPKRIVMVADAESYYKVCADDFDQDAYIFNCQNGVVNLRTGDFLDHDPGQMLSKVSNVVFDQAATCDRFMSFIDYSMEGDRELVKYLRKILGIALIGKNLREECYILFGPSTRNGKGTLMETLCHLFGDYAGNSQPESLAKRERSGSGPSPDLAKLKGVRLLKINEAPKDMNWDAALLKALTGRDAITARFLHENNFTFIPVCTVVMDTNYLPATADKTLFTSDRIKVIPFNRHVPEEDRDVHLKDTLAEQGSISGIFNWLLGGLMDYWSSGEKIIAPQSVKDATAQYQENNDKVQLFINECLDMQLDGAVDGATVYAVFSQWCADSGIRALSKKNFYTELRNKGIMYEYGEVEGKGTVYNVVKNYVITPAFISPEKYPEKRSTKGNM